MLRKSVLLSPPIYLLSTFRIPFSVARNLEVIQRVFLAWLSLSMRDDDIISVGAEFALVSRLGFGY